MFRFSQKIRKKTAQVSQVPVYKSYIFKEASLQKFVKKIGYPPQNSPVLRNS